MAIVVAHEGANLTNYWETFHFNLVSLPFPTILNSATSVQVTI